MTLASSDPGLARVRERLQALRQAVGEVAQESRRRLVLDAVRDALDRDGAPRSDAMIVANSYAVLGSLHEGAAFQVLALRQRDLGTLHALKLARANRRTDPLLRDMLLNEARCQGRIRHPACLPMQALLRLDDGRPAILLDRMEAPTLAQVAREQPFCLARSLALARRLAEALAAVHAAGLVHGDVSPANVFLPDRDPARAVLFDFGLARPIGAPWLGPDLAEAGTLDFRAPERRRAEALAHPAADRFALGRVLASCGDPEALAALATIVASLCRTEPEARPTDVGALVERGHA